MAQGVWIQSALLDASEGCDMRQHAPSCPILCIILKVAGLLPMSSLPTRFRFGILSEVSKVTHGYSWPVSFHFGLDECFFHEGVFAILQELPSVKYYRSTIEVL